jgi:hypothetical protein
MSFSSDAVEPVAIGMPNSIALDIPTVADAQFTRASNSQQYYLFKPEYAADFVAWWKEQRWALNRIANRQPLGVAWNAKRSAVVWQEFNQVADIGYGKPLLLCKRCLKAIAHPQVNGGGTTNLSDHLGSKSCKTSSARKSSSHRQLRIGETVPSQPQPVSTMSLRLIR